MVAEARPWPEAPTRALGEWLAGQDTPLVGSRVGPQYGLGVAHPQAALAWVAGPPEAAQFQLDVWADDDPTAQAACAQLCTALDGLAGATSNGVLLAGATVQSARIFPDGDLPRYIADVVVSLGTP